MSSRELDTVWHLFMATDGYVVKITAEKGLLRSKLHAKHMI